MMKELTLRTRDYLVSFGECMSTRLFAAYLNKIGHKARQYDAFEMGIITTDNFTNADVLEATYPAVSKRLLGDWTKEHAVPVVTGFLGKGWRSCAVTTLGRGGSDLTATTIGKALGLREVQVWKDVDGVLTCDPNIYRRAQPVPHLTFDEAAQLAYFGAQVLHPLSMRPASEGNIPVRVKNSYNPNSPGTLITRSRDMSKAVLTSIVLKRNVTMLDITSNRMLGQYGFLSKVLSTFEKMGISVDVVATSEVSVSLTLDPSKTAHELGVGTAVIAKHLEGLEQLLNGIAMMKELTLRTRDYLVSFGECMSTRLFTAYLNKIGYKARQYDAFEMGIITTDNFTNADVLEATYPAVSKMLLGDWTKEHAVPVVTGFLGKGWRSCAVTTLGRGGSDLTATTIGKALGLREVQVWKDVDGVLTCDPNIYRRAQPVPHLTFDEAAQLAYFGAQVLHPLSMRPAREGNIPVRVKNSYNPTAPGTLITRSRDMSKAVLTSIVLKRNVTMLDITSNRMLGQYGFLSKVLSTFEKMGISVDVVATSEVSVSLTLDPSKFCSKELIQQASFIWEINHVVEELEKIATVNLLQHRSIISLIGNFQRSSSFILEKGFRVLRTNGINVQMISQGASKVNISLIVNDDEAEHCVKALHSAFFETGTSKAVPQIGRLATTPLPCRENLLVQPDQRDLQPFVVGAATVRLVIVCFADAAGACCSFQRHRTLTQPQPQKVDLVFNRMLGQYGFLSKVLSTFEKMGISVDVVATSEVSVSLTLDPSKFCSKELIQQASFIWEINHVVEELEKIATVNISLIVNDDEAEHCVKALHSAFFETGTSKVVPQIGRLATTPLPCRETSWCNLTCEIYK
ncbi:hypothetical protein F2Q70_00014964 [Brassica cretica]|uniref:aspartate kinase n=1 Tax=Brassica cretica TaxID=69181 RepID=A0A8S9HVG2_BRACR|nr:hypothetical protein F2Q70_00014964 [Brassica cretica]